MPAKSKAQKSRKAKTSKEKTDSDMIAAKTVGSFEYSDFVGVRSYARGMLFSFGQTHPGSDKPIMTREVLLPFDVAHKLQKIMDGHLKNLQQRGLVTIEESAEDEE